MIKYEIFTKNSSIQTTDIRVVDFYKEQGFEVVTVVDLEVVKWNY